MIAGGNGSAPNNIPVVGGPTVTINGEAITVAPFFGDDKWRFDLWRTWSRADWEWYRRYGGYYILTDPNEDDEESGSSSSSSN